MIQNVPAGGLYQLELIRSDSDSQWIENGERGQTVSHFGVGDIYFIAGQSNAAGTGLGTRYDAPMLGVSNLRYLEKWELAVHPLKDRHSPFLAFAKKLYRNVHIPVGLCNFAVGGVPISRWILSKQGDLFRQMTSVAAEKGLTPKAILWYQGCSDTGNPDYEADFREFVEETRKAFRNDELPIYTFQLNSHLDSRKDIAQYSGKWDRIREIQRTAPYRFHDVYVIPTIDAQMSDGIHNRRADNVMLGERLANYVLRYSYGKEYYPIAPELSEVIADGKEITLTFKNIVSRLMTFHADGNDIPIGIEDENGKNPIVSIAEDIDRLNLVCEREFQGDVFVSCQCGARNRSYIHDLGTSMPTCVFYKVKAQKASKNG